MTGAVSVIVRVPPTVRTQLKQAALDEDRSMNEILNEIITAWLGSRHPESLAS